VRRVPFGDGEEGKKLMATTASITIEVDDQGALSALQDINTEAGKLGPRLAPVGAQSERAFGQMKTSVMQARESTALLSEELGIRMPRALRSVVAESSLLAPIMNAAFSGIAVVGFIALAVEAGKGIASVVDKMEGWTAGAKKIMDVQIPLNNSIVQHIAKMKELDQQYQVIGLTGLPLLAKQQDFANQKMVEAKKAADDAEAAYQKLFTASKQMLQLMTPQQQQAQNAALPPGARYTGPLAVPTAAATAVDAQKLATLQAKAIETSDTFKELQRSVKNAGQEIGSAFSKDRAEAIAQIGTDAQEALGKIQTMISGANTAGLSGEEQINANLASQHEALAKIMELSGNETSVREGVAQASVAIEKSAAAARIKVLTGEADAKIKAIDDLNDQIDQARKEEEQKDQAHAEKMRRMQFETLDAERQAAIATAPPWERANAQIVADYQYRMERIHEALATGDLDSQHAAAMAAAAWDIRFSEARDHIASTMQSLFDDITSGNIGHTFLKLFEQLVFRMVATWLAGLQAMHAASSGIFGGGSSGGIFGTIFSLLGLGGKSGAGGSGSTVGVDAGGLGIPRLGGGGGVTAAAALGGGAIASAAGLNFGSAAGSFAGAANAPNVSTSGLLTGLGLSAGQGGSVPGAVLPAGAGIFAQLQSKLGGSGGLAQLQATAGMALFSLAGKAGPFGGAGIGALAGALLGGIGAIIGAIIGGLLGLFGSSKRQKAIKNLEGQLEDQIKQVVDSYNNYQTDYSSAFQSLESLRSQYHDAMHKLGGDTNTRVEAHVNVAEQQIKATDAERQRRAAIVFGPAQFHKGGFVDPALAAGMPSGFASSALRFAGGGEVPAILHAGEFVLQPSAVRRMGRGSLERMNVGGGGGDIGGDIHIHGPLIHADKIDEAWLRNGGAKLIWQQFRRMANSGELEYGGYY
jgi:hypothetical protein